MSSKIVEVKALVEGGKATPGPPLGPALGPLKVNVPAIIKEINEATKEFIGIKVPIVVKVIPGKSFEVEVRTPQTSALLIKEAGASKGGGTAMLEPIGDIPFSSVLKVMRLKRDQMLSKNSKNAVKEILSTCFSCGITVDGKHPRDIQKAVESGEYDKKIGD